MTESFKLWSETNPGVVENINPKLGLREWDELTKEDKKKMYIYFVDKNWFINHIFKNFVFGTIKELNEKYKTQSYGINLLKHGGPHNTYNDLNDCCKDESNNDFGSIFINEKQDVVYEMLSIYALQLIDHNSLRWLDRASSEDERREKIEKAHEMFDRFVNCFNDIAEQFSINKSLTRNGFVPRQDEKITTEIYEPVLNFLSDPKWEAVNRELSDAFQDYQRKTEQGYSSCVTHTVTALQAYLQILTRGEIGKGDIGDLITIARNKKLIPDDKFTEQIFKNIESILMFERQQTSDAHPKKEYATEKNARLVLNLVMIFLQHCI